MKCFICGAENKDGAKYCSKCGGSLELFEGIDMDPEPTEEPPKDDKKLKAAIIGTAAVVAVALIAVPFAFGVGGSKKTADNGTNTEDSNAASASDQNKSGFTFAKDNKSQTSDTESANIDTDRNVPKDSEAASESTSSEGSSQNDLSKTIENLTSEKKEATTKTEEKTSEAKTSQTDTGSKKSSETGDGEKKTSDSESKAAGQTDSEATNSESGNSQTKSTENTDSKNTENTASKNTENADSKITEDTDSKNTDSKGENSGSSESEKSNSTTESSEITAAGISFYDAMISEFTEFASDVSGDYTNAIYKDIPQQVLDIYHYDPQAVLQYSFADYDADGFAELHLSMTGAEEEENQDYYYYLIDTANGTVAAADDILAESYLASNAVESEPVEVVPAAFDSFAYSISYSDWTLDVERTESYMQAVETTTEEALGKNFTASMTVGEDSFTLNFDGDTVELKSYTGTISEGLNEYLVLEETADGQELIRVETKDQADQNVQEQDAEADEDADAEVQSESTAAADTVAMPDTVSAADSETPAEEKDPAIYYIYMVKDQDGTIYIRVNYEGYTLYFSQLEDNEVDETAE